MNMVLMKTWFSTFQMMKMKNNIQVIRCERCNEKLNPKTTVWLELSMTDGKYYPSDKFPEGHESQGGFSFGRACAKTQLKETNEK